MLRADPSLTEQTDLTEQFPQVGQRKFTGHPASGRLPDGSSCAVQPVGQKPPVKGGWETILLVDDEAEVRKPVAVMLGKNGYQVLQAATGEEALEVWKNCSSRIRVLVTDMVMPGDLNGWELAQQLLDVQPALKVIYTSGYDPRMAAEVFEITSEIIFLQKPYLAERLLGAVREALATSKQTDNPETK